MAGRHYKLLIGLVILFELLNLSFKNQKEYFSLVLLPDTQFYTSSYPQVFHKQIDWIVKNRNHFNIKYVIHLGDVTNENKEYEWKTARSCFNKLDKEGIPFSLVYGDNDIKNPDINKKRYDGIRHTELLNKYFPATSFINSTLWFHGGFFEQEKIDNYYCVFDDGNDKFMIMNLEIAPRDEAISWANRIISEHLSRKVIVVTHDYIDPEGRRLDDLKDFGLDRTGNDKKAEGNNAETLYKKLIKDNSNIIMILCGHKSGECSKILKIKKSEYSEQKRVFAEILTDYQNEKLFGNGGKSGNGLLRVLKYYPGKKELVLTRINTLTDKTEGEKIKLSLEE